MFNLFRKQQLASVVANGLRNINKPSVARFCVEAPPRRIEKSKLHTVARVEVRNAICFHFGFQFSY